MSWFIFSEVMFFGAFFGALYWARLHTLPSLGGLENAILWPDFKAVWPSTAAGYTGSPAGIVEPFAVIGPWPLPTLNTALLLSSGVTLTIAHHALIANQRGKTIFWMWITVILGASFLGVQSYEYMHAYRDLNLKLSSGVFGSTFFMLTGASRARLGTGTSSTSSGSASTSSSTGSSEGRAAPHFPSGMPLGWIQPSRQATRMQTNSATETATRTARARIMRPLLEAPSLPRTMYTPASSSAPRMTAKAAAMSRVMAIDYRRRCPAVPDPGKP
jgi:heme/copper-type cytochrome/quinol oxidase subunit 3